MREEHDTTRRKSESERFNTVVFDEEKIREVVKAVDNAYSIREASRPYQFSIGQRIYLPFKRLLDIIISLIALTLGLPVMLAVSIAIKLDSAGHILFKQTRIGKGRKLFTVYKFRSMYLDTPPDLATAEFSDAEGYITPVGRFIRRTSLDELPQFLNVLMGQMSFIGPRPLIFKETEMDCLRAENSIYLIRPGITGHAQVNGRDSVTNEEKIHYDTDYLHNFSLITDFRILVKTIVVVIRGKDVAF